jgi:hypothetical protein
VTRNSGSGLARVVLVVFTGKAIASGKLYKQDHVKCVCDLRCIDIGKLMEKRAHILS